MDAESLQGAYRHELERYLISRGFAVYSHEPTDRLRAAAVAQANLEAGEWRMPTCDHQACQPLGECTRPGSA